MAMQQPYTLMDSIDVAGLLPSGSHGPVYVLQSEINSTGSHMAVSLSDQSIQVFSVASGAGGSRGVSVAHSRSINARSRSGRKKTEDDIASSHRITDVQFSPADPHVLYSCSTDCHVTVWDTRTSRSSASWRVGSDAQALAATVNGRGLAVATEAPVGSVDDAPLISLWDLRAQKRLHLYEGIHSEPISQLSWHPSKPQMLLSTAEDGLLCALDATASDPDDALGWCCNFETPVRSFGFFGPGSQHACALTCNESVQLCRLGEDVLQAFPDIRQKLQSAKSPAAFDYLVTSRFQQRSNRLLLLAGTNAGSLSLLEVKPRSIDSIGVLPRPPNAHCDVVRCALWTDDFLVTGGEDGKLCVWGTSATLSSSQGVEAGGSSGGKALPQPSQRGGRSGSGKAARPSSSSTRRKTSSPF